MDKLKNIGNLKVASWQEAIKIEDIDKAIQKSREQPVVFFKHSTTCGISARAKYDLEQHWVEPEVPYSFIYIDLLAHRNVSDYITEVTGVRHESPQIIVVRDGKVTYRTSHHSIRFKSLDKKLKN